jgi:hypothetical protein
MLRETFAEAPPFDTSGLAERCRDFSADRGLDSAETKALLRYRSMGDDYRIRPLIDTRELWREEKQQPDYDPSKPITRPLYPERADTLVYTEKGSVHCICPHTGEQRDLAFQGFEADRNTLKYRCPAAAYGLDCKGRAQCCQAGEVNPGDYGRIVRIGLDDHDRRIFVPTPHGSPLRYLRIGDAATTAAARSSASTTASTTASASSGISSAAGRKCRPVLAWPWR